MKISTIMSTSFLGLILNSSAFSADPVLTNDNEAINAACSTESTTAGCGTEKVGTGLLKCLHSYKKSHPEFKFSDTCKTAMQKRHADKAAGK